METDTTFVGTNGIIVLNAITHVGLYLAFIVNPCYAERDDAIGDAQALNEVGLFKFGMTVVLFFNCSKYLAHCLNVFRFIGKTLLEAFYCF